MDDEELFVDDGTVHEDRPLSPAPLILENHPHRDHIGSVRAVRDRAASGLEEGRERSSRMPMGSSGQCTTYACCACETRIVRDGTKGRQAKAAAKHVA